MTSDKLLAYKESIAKAAGAFCRKIHAPWVQYEDALQNAYLSVLIEGKDDAKDSVIGVLAYRRLIDGYRKETKYNRRAGKSNLRLVSSTETTLEPTTEEKPVSDESIAIERAFQQLSADEAEMVRDYLMYGVKAEELAARYGISKTTVYSRIREFKTLARRYREEIKEGV